MENNQVQTEILPIDLLMSGFRNAFLNRKVVGKIVGLTTITVFVLMIYRPKEYASDVTLSISGAISGDSSLVDPDHRDGAAAATKAYLNTQYELLLSRDMFEQVYESAKDIPCDQKDYESSKGNTFEFDSKKHIVVNPIRNTDLITIQARCHNPEAARDLADLYAQEFIKLKLREYQTERERVTTWRKQEVTRLKTILQDSEAELQAFRESQRVYSSQKSSELNDADIERLRTALVEEEDNRVRLMALKEQLAPMDSDDLEVDNILSIASLTDDATLEFLVMELSKISTALNANKKIYRDEHPTIIEDQIRYDETLQQIRTRIDVSSRGLEREIELADASLKRIRRDLNSLTSRTLSADRKVSMLATLEQSVDINQEMYRSFIEQTNNVVLSLGFVGDQIKLVGKAFIDTDPVSPNIGKNTLLAFIFSLFCSTFYFVLRAVLDPSIKHSDDVKLRLNAETLGYLPEIKTNQSQLAFNGYTAEPDNIFSEAVRSLRTSLQLIDIGADKKITAITSSVPHEGKSTVAMNIAAAFGQVEKVLLIDCDIRRETLSRSLDMKEGRMGLVNLLSEEASTEDCIVDDASKFYSFLPAGRYVSDVADSEGNVPHSSVELLTVGKLEALLDKLKQEYDHIIIDCPPVCGISDAKIVATCATRVVYVIAAFQTSSKVVQSGFKELQSSNIQIAGAVLNKVDVEKAHAYTNVSYYSYGYGYGSKNGQAV